MIIRKILLASSLALAVSGPALAADAIVEVPEPPVATIDPTPAYLWSGGYVGGFGAYVWGETDAGSIDADGFAGGLYGGYNWQTGSWVYGVEADVGLSAAEGTLGAVTVEQDVFGSLRARMGYDFNPFMLYATGGVAATQATLTSGANSDSNTHIGWTAGAGVEGFLTENVTARVEYRYSDYGDETYNLGGTAISSGFDDHSVRMGIGVKF